MCLLSPTTATYSQFAYPNDVHEREALGHLGNWAKYSFTEKRRTLLTIDGIQDVPCVAFGETTLKPMMGHYDITLKPMLAKKQMWSTLVVAHNQMKLALSKIPGFLSVLRAVRKEMRRITGIWLTLWDCHFLLQGVGLECASSWDEHCDVHDGEDRYEDWCDEEKRSGRDLHGDQDDKLREFSRMGVSVVLLLIDTNADGPSSGMQVVGFKVASYGTKAGGAVAFASHCKHTSLPTDKATGVVYKMPCFFTVGAVGDFDALDVVPMGVVEVDEMNNGLSWVELKSTVHDIFTPVVALCEAVPETGTALESAKHLSNNEPSNLGRGGGGLVLKPACAFLCTLKPGTQGLAIGAALWGAARQLGPGKFGRAVKSLRLYAPTVSRTISLCSRCLVASLTVASHPSSTCAVMILVLPR